MTTKCAHRLQLVGQRREQRDQRPVDEDDLVLGVVGDVDELLGEQPDVEGVQHPAGARRGQVELQVARGVPAERADPAVRADAQRVEHRGEPAHPHRPLGDGRAWSRRPPSAVTIGLCPKYCSARWKTCGRVSGRSCISPSMGLGTPRTVPAVSPRKLPGTGHAVRIAILRGEAVRATEITARVGPVTALGSLAVTPPRHGPPRSASTWAPPGPRPCWCARTARSPASPSTRPPPRTCSRAWTPRSGRSPRGRALRRRGPGAAGVLVGRRRAAAGRRRRRSGSPPPRPAHRVACSAGARVVHVHAGPLEPADVRMLRSARPGVVLLIGGSDGDDPAACCTTPGRLARARIRFPIVLAGNSRRPRRRRCACCAATGRTVVACDNVVPRPGEIVPAPARAALARALRPPRRWAGGARPPRRGSAGWSRSRTPDAVAARRRASWPRICGGRRAARRRRLRHHRRALRAPTAARRRARSRATSGCARRRPGC